MSVLHYLMQKARQCRQQVTALSIACRDPRTPWYAKAIAAAVVAYAVSPIDLIPDFIPVLGYLDDVILLPLGIMLAIRMIPTQVLAESRTRAQSLNDRPIAGGRRGALVIIGIWAAAIGGCIYVALRLSR